MDSMIVINICDGFNDGMDGDELNIEYGKCSCIEVGKRWGQLIR